VVSIGGSVLITGQNDRPYLEELAELLRRVGARRPLVVTTGGGRTAREYIRIGRDLGLTGGLPALLKLTRDSRFASRRLADFLDAFAGAMAERMIPTEQDTAVAI
jgi:uridylate kinase